MRDEILQLLDMLETVVSMLDRLNTDVTNSRMEHEKLCEPIEQCNRKCNRIVKWGR